MRKRICKSLLLASIMGGTRARAPHPHCCKVEFLTNWVCLPPLTLKFQLLLTPPEQAAELLPWYMQWSRDLAAEMHQRRLVRDKARRTNRPPISNRPCDCASEWRCEPHGACFIHDSCFCPGSGSFPPVKPPRS